MCAGIVLAISPSAALFVGGGGGGGGGVRLCAHRRSARRRSPLGLLLTLMLKRT
jgi:hypothetical protein